MPPFLWGFRVAVPALRLCGSHLLRLVSFCLMALTIQAIQSDSKSRQHGHHINHWKHWRSSACRNHTTAAKRRRAPQPRPRRATATSRDATAASRRPRHGHDGYGHDRIQRNVPARYHTTRQNTIAQTFQRCTMQQTPPWGSVPPAQKARPLAL